MKISQNLPQFEDKNTLLVAMGNHHGIIYHALNGELEQIDELRVEAPEYSDNEGSFRQGNANNISFGSVLEPKKQEYQERFSKEFAEKINEYFKSKPVDQIYLFYAKDMNHLIEKDWSNDLKSITLIRFAGNHVSDAPTDLIKMIQKEMEEKSKVEPTGEAKEILDRTNRK